MKKSFHGLLTSFAIALVSLIAPPGVAPLPSPVPGMILVTPPMASEAIAPIAYVFTVKQEQFDMLSSLPPVKQVRRSENNTERPQSFVSKKSPTTHLLHKDPGRTY